MSHLILAAVLLGGQLVAGAEAQSATPRAVVLVTTSGGVGLDKAEVRKAGQAIVEQLNGLGLSARTREDRRPISATCLPSSECAKTILEPGGAVALLTVALSRVGALARLRFQLWSATGLVAEEVVTADAQETGTAPAVREALGRLAAAATALAPAPAAVAAMPAATPAATPAEPLPLVEASPAPAASSRTGPWILIGTGGLLAAGGTVLLGLAAVDWASVEGARRGTPWQEAKGAYYRAPIELGTGVTALCAAAVLAAIGIVWLLEVPGVEPAPTAAAPAGLLVRF